MEKNKNFYDIYMKYMSMTKEELAMLLTSYEMLKIDVDLKDISNRKAITEDCYKKCKSWFYCDNPFRDCVNCPLRYQTADYPINEGDDFYSNINSTTNDHISEIILTKDDYDYLRENSPH